MARTADHDARHRQIYGAVRRISATRGLGAVTVAATAKEAGVSVGLVQHYYPRKGDLLVSVHATLIAEIEARVTAAVAEREDARQRIETILPAALEEMLPVDDERRSETYLLLAFSGMALEHPAVQAESVRWQQRLRNLVTRAVENGKECGEVPPDTDCILAAREICATVRGLIWSLYEEHQGSDINRAREVLADQAARWFPGLCARTAGAGA